MNRTLHRSAVRGGVVVALAAGATLLAAGPASAHVTAQPGQVASGGSAVVSFRVPDESDTAGTVELEVALPTDHPITSVRTTPMPGWTATVAKATLNPPVQVNGNAVTQAVSTVTWTANPGTRIGPGEFLDFPLWLGPLPTGVDQLALPATQTYDDGTVVAWNQPTTGGEEPEHPAPVVRLVAAAGGDAMAGPPAPAAAPPHSGTDETARWMARAGLLVGALGLGVGVGALLRGRRAGAP
jgi:periplasmic copper chaperone A